MKANDRHSEILKVLKAEGFSAVETLAERFAVTPQTMRRDINQLSAQGLLRRHHGGASLPVSTENIAFEDRQVLNLEAKRSIAALAAGKIPPSASLFIGIGTTAEQAAMALSDKEGLRVITNNLHVANILCAQPSCEVILPGGVVHNIDRSITGDSAIEFISRFRADIALLGIGGIDNDGTLLEFGYHESRVTQAMLENARQVFLLADHSKFRRNAMVRAGHVRQVDILFTDRPIKGELAALLDAEGVEVAVASE